MLRAGLAIVGAVFAVLAMRMIGFGWGLTLAVGSGVFIAFLVGVFANISKLGVVSLLIWGCAVTFADAPGAEAVFASMNSKLAKRLQGEVKSAIEKVEAEPGTATAATAAVQPVPVSQDVSDAARYKLELLQSIELMCAEGKIQTASCDELRRKVLTLN